MIKFIILVSVVLTMTSCLRTRSELTEIEQADTYGKKAASNQIDAQPNSQIITQTQIDDKDELIRGLNGRLEVLENQLTSLLKDREQEKIQNQEKLILLQQGLTQLEAQVNPSENDINSDVKKNTSPDLASSDDLGKKKITDKSGTVETINSKLNSFETGENYFSKREWKKAILSFHKYTDEAPKSKLIPDAKFKIGISFQELGMKEEAMAYYEEVVANYGASETGKKAKLRLTKLKK